MTAIFPFPLLFVIHCSTQTCDTDLSFTQQ